MQPRFGGNRQIACRRGERLVVDETAPHRRLPLPGHRQTARTAPTLGPGPALIFAGTHSAGEPRTGVPADPLLPANMPTLVRLTAGVGPERIFGLLGRPEYIRLCQRGSRR